MYKVLIVDDEKIIRIALKSMISWESLGFSADYAAEDGLSALEVLKKHRLDLIIVDIMMPKMDGIEFVKVARDYGYTGEIIILSNHQNFQYAVEALRNRVSDYIMKTDITPQSLTQCLIKIKQRLDASIPSDTDGTEDSPEDRDILRLQDVLKAGAVSDDTPLSGSYVFLNVFTRNSLAGNAAQNDMASNALKNLTLDYLRDSSYHVLELNENSLMIIVPEQALNNTGETFGFTNKLQKLVQLYLNTDCGFILSGIFNKCSELLKMTMLLPEAEQSVLYHDFGNIITENEYNSYLDKSIDPVPFINDLKHHLDQEDFAGCKTCIKNLTEYLSSEKYHPRQAVRLFGKVFDFVVLHETIDLSSSPEQTGEIRQMFCHASTLREYRTAFDRLFDFLASQTLTLKISTSSYRKEILLIIEYIRQNINLKITLSMLARNVNMSENYISRLFKAETGINVVNYINQLKMNHARLLLEDRELSVRDIALSLGFDEASYFNKLFFKFFGVSPTRYRKMITDIMSK